MIEFSSSFGVGGILLLPDFKSLEISTNEYYTSRGKPAYDLKFGVNYQFVGW